jgi:hypothetical protein
MIASSGQQPSSYIDNKINCTFLRPPLFNSVENHHQATANFIQSVLVIHVVATVSYKFTCRLHKYAQTVGTTSKPKPSASIIQAAVSLPTRASKVQYDM